MNDYLLTALNNTYNLILKRKITETEYLMNYYRFNQIKTLGDYLKLYALTITNGIDISKTEYSNLPYDYISIFNTDIIFQYCYINTENYNEIINRNENIIIFYNNGLPIIKYDKPNIKYFGVNVIKFSQLLVKIINNNKLNEIINCSFRFTNNDNKKMTVDEINKLFYKMINSLKNNEIDMIETKESLKNIYQTLKSFINIKSNYLNYKNSKDFHQLCNQILNIYDFENINFITIIQNENNTYMLFEKSYVLLILYIELIIKL